MNEVMKSTLSVVKDVFTKNTDGQNVINGTWDSALKVCRHWKFKLIQWLREH